jgi:hypothetical protein
MSYMHFLTWVGFGLIGCVPNTFYMYDLLCMFIRYLVTITQLLKDT